MKRFISWAAVVGLAAAAWGADVAVEAAAPGVGLRFRPTDGERELKWDSGTHGWWLADWTGLNFWMGNDFDVSTIKKYDGIKAIRVMAGPVWPNYAWDGFRLAIFGFNAVPGSLMWPTTGGGYFFKPKGETGWKEIPVNWTLPGGVTAFVAAVNQYYDWPNVDPGAIDDNPTFMGHSWMYFRGRWEIIIQGWAYPYRNSMIRVVVANDLAVTPTSIGRVKALYY
jgi:hypothetical protein